VRPRRRSWPTDSLTAPALLWSNALALGGAPAEPTSLAVPALPWSSALASAALLPTESAKSCRRWLWSRVLRFRGALADRIAQRSCRCARARRSVSTARFRSYHRAAGARSSNASLPRAFADDITERCRPLAGQARAARAVGASCRTIRLSTPVLWLRMGRWLPRRFLAHRIGQHPRGPIEHGGRLRRALGDGLGEGAGAAA